MEFDIGGGGGGGGGGGRRGPLLPSTPPSPIRAAASDAALDDFGGSRGRAPLQDRLQAAPTYLRERAVDLREDARDRVHDIRVRDDDPWSVCVA